jgi:hypothetical protein
MRLKLPRSKSLLVSEMRLSSCLCLLRFFGPFWQEDSSQPGEQDDHEPKGNEYGSTIQGTQVRDDCPQDTHCYHLGGNIGT